MIMEQLITDMMSFNEKRRRRMKMNKYHCLSQSAFLSRHYRREAITMVRRLELLSAAQHSLFCPSLIQLQSKLINVYLDSNISTQKPILNFFKLVNVN